MKKVKTFSSATAFRTSLEERIASIKNKEGIDTQRARKQISFDRLLARLFHLPNPPWVLKGGYSMQLRTDRARTTQDIDLAMKQMQSSASQSEAEVLNDLLLSLRKAAEIDLKDFFVFEITGPVKDLDAAPYGGGRFQVHAKVDSRTFDRFSLDVGIGDVWLEPLTLLESRQWLDFAGVQSPPIPAISPSQQFSEKIHAYTLPRPSGLNSRVKDLVDMVLLIEAGFLDEEATKSAIQATYKRRCTHDWSATLERPPESWRDRFVVLADECGIGKDLDQAFQTVQHFVRSLVF